MEANGVPASVLYPCPVQGVNTRFFLGGGDEPVKINKQEHPTASRPWSEPDRPMTYQEAFVPGSDPPEAIALCLNCKKVRCHFRCNEVAAVIRAAREKAKDKPKRERR